MVVTDKRALETPAEAVCLIAERSRLEAVCLIAERSKLEAVST